MRVSKDGRRGFVNFRVYEDGTVYEEQRSGWLRVRDERIIAMMRARAGLR